MRTLHFRSPSDREHRLIFMNGGTPDLPEPPSVPETVSDEPLTVDIAPEQFETQDEVQMEAGVAIDNADAMMTDVNAQVENVYETAVQEGMEDTAFATPEVDAAGSNLGAELTAMGEVADTRTGGAIADEKLPPAYDPNMDPEAWKPVEPTEEATSVQNNPTNVPQGDGYGPGYPEIAKEQGDQPRTENQTEVADATTEENSDEPTPDSEEEPPVPDTEEPTAEGDDEVPTADSEDEVADEPTIPTEDTEEETEEEKTEDKSEKEAETEPESKADDSKSESEKEGSKPEPQEKEEGIDEESEEAQPDESEKKEDDEKADESKESVDESAEHPQEKINRELKEKLDEADAADEKDKGPLTQEQLAEAASKKGSIVDKTKDLVEQDARGEAMDTNTLMEGDKETREVAKEDLGATEEEIKAIEPLSMEETKEFLKLVLSFAGVSIDTSSTTENKEGESKKVDELKEGKERSEDEKKLRTRLMGEVRSGDPMKTVDGLIKEKTDTLKNGEQRQALDKGINDSEAAIKTQTEVVSGLEQSLSDMRQEQAGNSPQNEDLGKRITETESRLETEEGNLKTLKENNKKAIKMLESLTGQVKKDVDMLNTMKKEVEELADRTDARLKKMSMELSALGLSEIGDMSINFNVDHDGSLGFKTDMALGAKLLENVGVEQVKIEQLSSNPLQLINGLEAGLKMLKTRAEQKKEGKVA